LFSGITFGGQYSGYAAQNSFVAVLYQTTEAGVFTALTDVNFTNTALIMATIVYRAA